MLASPEKRIPFVLGHALAMNHIHQGKSKSDKLDAGKLAAMLRGGVRHRQSEGDNASFAHDALRPMRPDPRVSHYTLRGQE